jgi:broad specificity phosphatase PhoE
LDAAPGTRLLLVRHGETQWNLDQRVQGHHDVPLTERGIQQAQRLAAWLSDEPLEAIYSSDLIRARATAEVLADERLPVNTDARFREGGFGLFEGLTTTEIQDRYPEEFRLWREGAVDHRPPGGETLEALRERCVAGARDALANHGGQTIMIVAHGGPVRVMVCGLLGLDIRHYPQIRVENTSVTRIYYTQRGPILASLNEVGHLHASAAIAQHTGWEEK